MINYKGIYFEDDSGQKFQCPETGAHFEYVDMFRRLKRVLNKRTKEDEDERLVKEEQNQKENQENLLKQKQA